MYVDLANPLWTLLVVEAMLAATYVTLGFAARRHYDRTLLEEAPMSRAWLLLFPFFWPLYKIYLPSARPIRSAGCGTFVAAILLWQLRPGA
jgi:hypothetical protein